MGTGDKLVLFICTALAVSLVGDASDMPGEIVVAGCTVMPNKNYKGPETIRGEVRIVQYAGIDAIDGVAIKVDLTGFDPSKNKLHGFHVHEFGDLSGGCESTGGHYNPFNKHHGAPTDKERHVGDLGNVKIDSIGNVKTVIVDDEVSLVGKHSVIGRAFVIHEGVDDLGLGGDEGSLTTGNAGARMACCVIGVNSSPK
ncbi:uncharacterized protein [Ptychodera flava]|uniref:uncharacterized protein n=1 Tax=Ptychodera flava TaxID=63121 RepID=UPI00396A69C1